MIIDVTLYLYNSIKNIKCTIFNINVIRELLWLTDFYTITSSKRYKEVYVIIIVNINIDFRRVKTTSNIIWV